MTTCFYPRFDAVLATLCLAFCCSLYGAAGVKQRFDIPADTADKSLKLFSEQAGLEVFYQSDVTDGVRTKAVKGQMVARAALDALLTGTVLQVVQDEKTGAFSIRRVRDPKGQRAALPTTSDRPNQRRLFVLPAGIAEETLKRFSLQAGVAVVYATESSSRARTNAVKGSYTMDEAIGMLLKDSGLIAVPSEKTGTLTITREPGARRMESAPEDRRSNPPIKDDEPTTLSPFEVNTDRDTGFVASSSLAGGRLNGELKDTPIAYSVITRDFIDALLLTDLNEMSRWTPNTYETPDSGINEAFGGSIFISSRGLSGSTTQRDFFPFSYNFDSYNVERLDRARGPNAVLFGSSGGGGAANSVSKRARFDRRLTEVRATLGSWEKYRGTLDHNELVKPGLAVRLNTLYEDAHGWRQFEYSRRKAAALAATWKPLRDTEVRVNVERARMTKAVSVSNFNDFFSAWDGTSTFAARITAPIPARGVIATDIRTIVYTPSTGPGTLINYQGMPMTEGGNLSATYPVGGTLVVGNTANVRSNPITQVQNLPSTIYDKIVAGSHFRVPSREFAMSVERPGYNLTGRDLMIAVTQKLGERMFAEVAIDLAKDLTIGDTAPNRYMQNVLIDINSALPTGAKNPNFLEPYMETPSYPQFLTEQRNNYRGSFGYLSPTTRFGSLAFNVIGGVSESRRDTDAFVYVLKDNADPRTWPSFEQVRFRYYFNTDHERPLPNDRATWTYINPLTNTTRTANAGLVRDYISITSNNGSKIKYTYTQAALNAKLLKGRLHLLGAARRDNYASARATIVMQYDNPTDWDGYTLNVKPPAPTDYTALTYRQRDTSGAPFGAALPADIRPRISGMRDARYATDRFRDDFSAPASKGTVNTVSAGSVFNASQRISLFFNYAQSFVPPGAALRITGELFIPQKSDGWDFGVRFTSQEGGLSATVTRYVGKEKARPISGSLFATSLTRILVVPPMGETSPGAINALGLPLIPASYTDVAEAQTEGWELDLTANLSKQWRLLFNVALPKGVQSNTYQDTRAYLDANYDTLRRILLDAGALFDSNGIANLNPALPPFSTFANGVAAWNVLNADLAAVGPGTGKQKLTRITECTANLYTDFTLPSGLFKGLRFGGGFNFRGRQVIGYKGANTIRSSTNPAVAVDDPAVGSLDVVYADAYTTATFTTNYTRRIHHGKYTLGLDFKIDNLFDYDRPIYYSTVLRPVGGDLTNPGRVATPQRFSWLTPRSYTFSASLKF